jgi:hypothetical protein
VDEIKTIAVVRNQWWNGFGIRMRPDFRLYNVSGLDAVELRLNSGDVRCIGTDDPHGLYGALNSHEAPRSGLRLGRFWHADNPDAGATGQLGALGVRQWRCDECATLHDRDINSARNIEIAGAERRPPVAEIPALQGGEDVKSLVPTRRPSRSGIAARLPRQAGRATRHEARECRGSAGHH